MFRRIGRIIKEAFWGITHHFAMAFSTANAITVTLVLVVVFATLVLNVSQITMDVEDDIQIYTPIENDLGEDEVLSLKNRIEKIPGVALVEFSDKEKELNDLITSFGEDGKIFSIYKGENNPLPDAFLVRVTTGYSLDQIASQIESLDGTASATYGGATIEEFVTLLAGIRAAGYGFTLGLAALAIFLIYNTIKITIHSRRTELGIMRLCGASNSYITAPLVLEGIIIGIMGSIAPILLTIFGYRFVYERMDGQLVSGILKLIPVYPFVFYVSAFALAIGVTVGFIGSMLSANRYVRKKR